MTRVERYRNSTGSGSPQGSRTSSDGNSTPFDFASASGVNQAIVPLNFEFDFDFHPGAGLPSTASSPSTNERVQTPSTPSTPRPQIPTLSVSPSPLPSNETPIPTIEDRERSDTIENLDGQLEGLRLVSERSGIDMEEISDALGVVAAGQDRPINSRIRSPSPANLSPGRPRARSRRPSSIVLYNVREEAPADDRFNIPAVQKALQDARGLMSKLQNVLGNNAVQNEHDSVIARLQRQAKDLSEFKSPATRIVGFVGDSGAGKSSLINALLDYKQLAVTGSNGNACTCIATEFHFHENERFHVEIEIVTDGELIPHLEDLLRDYRQFHLNRNAFELLDERDYLRKQASIANDTFKAMFRNHFTNQDILKQGSGSEALLTMKSWVQDFRNRSMPPLEHFGLSLDECSKVLLEVNSEKSRTPLWPWIKKIKVFSNAHILSKGLILVDLPGLYDVDSFRCRNTELYIRKCNEIFIVADQSRAVTSEGVKKVIELAKQDGLPNINIGIICTKSDFIKPNEAAMHCEDDETANEIRRQSQVIADKKSEISELNKDIQGYYDVELDDEEKFELDGLNNQLRRIEKSLAQHELDLRNFIVADRNASVKKKLVDSYRGEVPGNSLAVFCTSETIYWKHRTESKQSALPHLKLSGIPEVREYCMAMVSEGQYNAAANYVWGDIGALLGDLTLWSLGAQNNTVIRNTLNIVEEMLDLELRGHASTLNGMAHSYKSGFNTMILQPYRSHVDRWSAAADDACDEWSGLHHSTYAAFCRKYGIHQPLDSPEPRNWNSEIIKEMKNDLGPAWEELRISLDEQGERILAFVDSLFNQVSELLDTQLNGSRDVAVSIRSTLYSRRRLLRADIETSLDSLRGNLRTLRTNTFSGIRTSSIGQIMESEYREARYQSGTKSHSRRKAIIASAVQREGLFDDMFGNFKKDFEGHVDDTQVRIREAAESHFQATKDTFATLEGGSMENLVR
ncbi:hypothetical protein GGR51DRAFT_542081 [Nemania sp. FL0031]|nr:hypothetical protein GGR51DRAFT_542081 [Nemania sp. FL0031]